MDIITVESVFLEIRKEQKEMMRKIDRIAYTIGISPEYEKGRLNSNDVCGMLNVSYRTLLRMKADGEINCSKIRRRCVYKRSDIERFIRDNRKYA